MGLATFRRKRELETKAIKLQDYKKKKTAAKKKKAGDK